MISTSANSEQAAQLGAPEFIEMRGISKRFGGVRALTNVSFSIRSGEIHCLAGENGCGKSTLIKILSGVHNPDEGEIILEGKAHSHLSPAASQRFGVQIIYSFGFVTGIIILISVSATAIAAKRQQGRTVGNVV